MPRFVPALNVLPLEEPSEWFGLGRHSSASQLDLRLCEHPRQG